MTTVEVRESGTDPGVGGTRREPGPRRRRVLLGLVALAAFSAALGFLVANEVQANTQSAQAHRQLVAARHRIHATLDTLAAVRHDLATEQGRVTRDSTVLHTDASRLAEVKTALSGARAHVTSQASSVADLHACLGGVQQAANALAVGDQNGAIAALDGVAASCAGAVAAHG